MYWSKFIAFFFLWCSLIVVKPSVVFSQNYANTGLRSHIGFLMKQTGFIVDADQVGYFRNNQINAIFTDIKTGRVIHFKNNFKAMPVARSSGLEKIIFEPFEVPKDELIVTDSKLEVLEKIALPKNQNDPSWSEHYVWSLIKHDKILVGVSDHDLYLYFFETKKWSHLLSTTKGQDKIIPIGVDKYFIFNEDQQNTLVVRTSLENAWGELNYSLYNVFTGEKIGNRKIKAQEGFLVDEHYIVTRSPTELIVWDSKTDLLKAFPKKDDVMAHFSFGPGPGASFFIITLDGKLALYDLEYQLIFEQKLANKVSQVEIIDGSGGFFYREVNSNEPFFFDIKNRVKIEYLALFGSSLNQSSVVYSNDKFYISIWNLDGFRGNGSVLELDSQFISLENHKLKDLFTQNSPEKLLRENICLILKLMENSKLNEVSDSILTKLVAMPEFDEVAKNILNVMTSLYSQSDEIKFSVYEKYFQMLRKYLSKMPLSQKTELITRTAVSKTEKLRFSIEFKDVPPSKIANLFEELLKPFFDMPSKDRTDVALMHESRNTIIPLILGTQPIDDDSTTMSPFGFYMKKLDRMDIQLGEIKKIDLNWTHAGKSVAVKGAANLLSLEYLIKKASAPNYKQLWSDKKLTGAFLISSNLGSSAENLLLIRKIISYYKAEGFEFGPQTFRKPENIISFWSSLTHLFWFPQVIKELSDGKLWLQEQIESGNLDYLVKEAHSGGIDEVMELAPKNNLIVGKKFSFSGKKEEIFILYPAEINSTSLSATTIKTEDFAKWINKRGSNHGQELVYVNSSCWSTGVAKKELIAARNPLLVEIPTYGSTLTFEAKNSNPEKTLIDMIRKNKTYDEIKQRLSAITETKNSFILPNEDLYQNTIWSQLESALDYNFEISVDGKPK